MKKPIRDLVGLFILALIVRGLAAAPQQQPSYMDALYSYVNAQNLAAGRGFVEDFVWNYLGNPPPPPPPGPSHLYWLPLTSMLAWAGFSVAGVSYRAAQLPFVVLSALLAPLSYSTVWALNGKRWQGWLAGLLAIFSGFYFPFWTAIDNFTPFAVAGSLALLLAWRGLESEERRAWGVERGAGSVRKSINGDSTITKKGVTGTRKRLPQDSPSPDDQAEKRATVTPTSPANSQASAGWVLRKSHQPGRLSSRMGE